MLRLIVLLVFLGLLHTDAKATRPDVSANRMNAQVKTYIDGFYAALQYQHGQKKIAPSCISTGILWLFEFS